MSKIIITRPSCPESVTVGVRRIDGFNCLELNIGYDTVAWVTDARQLRELSSALEQAAILMDEPGNVHFAGGGM